MDIPSRSELVARVDAFLLRHDIAPSRFGRDVTGEPNLVTTLRDGRELKHGALIKVLAFMAERDAKAKGETSFIGADPTAEDQPAHRLSAAVR